MLYVLVVLDPDGAGFGDEETDYPHECGQGAVGRRGCPGGLDEAAELHPVQAKRPGLIDKDAGHADVPSR